MNTGLLSKRYAKALYLLSVEKGVQTAVYEQSKALVHIFADHNDFFKVLDNPVLSKKQKTEFIFSFLDQASESVLKSFIRMVVTNRREQFLKVILLSYLDIYRNEHDIFSGKLIVASDVNTELEKKLISVIENKTKGVVEIEKNVRPEIIGGFILEVDNTRWDASVSGQLRVLRNGFVEQNKKTI